MLTLTAGALSLGVEPGLGASIAWFRRHSVPLLRETPIAAVQAKESRAFSAFPLIPFSNRIRNGAFGYAGEHYMLGRDAEDRRHALHGTARFLPWKAASQTASSVRCTLNYTPQAFDWPFAYQAWQAFDLSADRLRITIGLRNTHKFAAPFGIGLHPYFVRVPGTSLRFDAGYIWGKDPREIPVNSIPDSGRYNFARRHAMDEGLIDNYYGDWGGVLEISAPGRPKLTLKANKTFSNLVLLTPPDQRFFAAEPASHRPDAVNPNDDPFDAGMTILAPGEVLEGVVELLVAE